MKKIRIFLGAYVNYPNAQNVNCDNIAKYLNKEKFEVHTMYTHKLPIDIQLYEKQGIHLHKLIHHRFIWYWCKYLTMLFGNYDIYYFPKMEKMDRYFAKKHRDKICISSVEGVITENTNNTENFKNYYTKYMTGFFSISECIAKSVKKYWGIESKVIPLGTISVEHLVCDKKEVKQIAWIGNVKANKRPQYLIECAKLYKNLQFKMIGDGDLLEKMREYCQKEDISNVVFYGRISNEQVYSEMRDCDLLLMTSEYEGLPKVIQEAAQMKLPCIYINQNYSVDFVIDGQNGFAVPNLESLKQKIQYLLDNPEIYQRMSEAAFDSIQPYTWVNVIKQYEEYFEMIYKEKGNKK